MEVWFLIHDDSRTIQLGKLQIRVKLFMYGTMIDQRQLVVWSQELVLKLGDKVGYRKCALKLLFNMKRSNCI